jgi:hypothetical protein
VALIRTDVSEDRIASIFRVHECELVTERSCLLLYRHKLVGLMMEAIRSSEASVLIRATRRHLPEDDNHHSHRRGDLKSYLVCTLWHLSPSLPSVCVSVCVSHLSLLGVGSVTTFRANEYTQQWENCWT